MSNALLRILTALVGIPLVVGLLYAGGGWLLAGVLLTGILAQREVYDMMAAGGLAPHRKEGLLLGVLLVLWALMPGAGAMAVLVFVLLLAASPLRKGTAHPLSSLAATVFGALYPACLLGFLVRLREARGPLVDGEAAFWLALATVALVWITDTFAYYAGRAFGRHPLAPTVSPKKTWEGAIGGAVGGLLGAVVFRLTVLPFLDWPHVVALGLIGGVVSQLGDLAESRMKRSVGVKDSGTLLPGHGGLLDRIDALLLAIPLAYLYLAHVAHLFAGAP
ncbi:MAG: phosphatidate cytidylyltransferase [Bacteroidetes bacterium]|nr:MAG: phosphatidate cytidylyltransferase [Bacteroidota bacterium]